MYGREKMNEPNIPKIITICGIIVAALIAAVMGGCPRYNVYSAHMAGEAELSQATANRQIAVQEAQAKREAATELAKAEIERDKGVAGANSIIADSLKGNDAYLRYLWITEVAAGGKDTKTVVYVPTEANLPILEAGKRP
jgi:regulator of protease activity HflC (stomatin/prohibitin superfamily)